VCVCEFNMSMIYLPQRFMKLPFSPSECELTGLKMKHCANYVCYNFRTYSIIIFYLKWDSHRMDLEYV